MTINRIVFTAMAALILPTATAFTAPSTSTFTLKKSTPISALSAIPTDLLTDIHAHIPSSSILLSDETVLSPAVEAARQKFWFYFFAGSGAGGIGISQLPAIFRDASAARTAAETGSSLGGEALNAGPLLGIYYNKDISVKDVVNAIQKAPTAEFISSRSQSVNYLASKGYIDRRDFIREMDGKGCNPLASYAVYDAISAGKGDLVNPDVYDDKLAVYREGGSSAGQVASSFVGDLNGFLAVKVGAFLGLLFCLLVDFGFIAKAGIEGFLS